MIARTCIRLRVSRADISFLVQVMEGYDHVGVVTTVDPGTGDVVLQVTPDTYEDALEILRHLPVEVEMLPE